MFHGGEVEWGSEACHLLVFEPAVLVSSLGQQIPVCRVLGSSACVCASQFHGRAPMGVCVELRCCRRCCGAAMLR